MTSKQQGTIGDIKPLPLNSKTLKVSKCTKNIEEGHMKEIFGRYGTVVDAQRQLKGNTGMKDHVMYVTFEKWQDMELAYCAMNHTQIDGQKISIEFLSLEYTEINQQDQEEQQKEQQSQQQSNSTLRNTATSLPPSIASLPSSAQSNSKNNNSQQTGGNDSSARREINKHTESRITKDISPLRSRDNKYEKQSRSPVAGSHRQEERYEDVDSKIRDNTNNYKSNNSRNQKHYNRDSPLQSQPAYEQEPQSKAVYSPYSARDQKYVSIDYSEKERPQQQQQMNKKHKETSRSDNYTSNNNGSNLSEQQNYQRDSRNQKEQHRDFSNQEIISTARHSNNNITADQRNVNSFSANSEQKKQRDWDQHSRSRSRGDQTENTRHHRRQEQYSPKTKRGQSKEHSKKQKRSSRSNSSSSSQSSSSSSQSSGLSRSKSSQRHSQSKKQ